MADRVLAPTVSQTVGPFFHIGLGWLFSDRVADPEARGRHITVRGRVVDGDGAPVPDALIEVWQADPDGRYIRPGDAERGEGPRGFRGYARVPTNDEGAFRFTTVKPGRVTAPGGAMQAPHMLAAVFMRGLLRQLATRIYFADEPSNVQDPILLRVPAPRRGTLVARPLPDSPDVFEWNVMLQGTGETVFFDV
jgi:protocatechuate 3,4-dioxygenase alpha subunit